MNSGQSVHRLELESDKLVKLTTVHCKETEKHHHDSVTESSIFQDEVQSLFSHSF